MTTNQTRIVLQWVHIVFGLVILCYIYSPFSKYLLFQIFIKFIVVPVIVLTGLWLWKFKEFNKFLRIKS
ncbi:MAG: hypothetical protein H6753_05435 [Candidatus Omnitrophica bacterium]|nr:hypothetical protein [Candidatus Omnitrophota bacterium]